MKYHRADCFLGDTIGLHSTIFLAVLTLSSPTCALSPNHTSELHKISTTMREIPQGYDKHVPPILHGSTTGHSVTVQVTMFVSAFGEFNYRESIFDINFYLRQTWKDRRLAFLSNSSKKISLTPSFLEDIWIPDTTFVNVKEAKLHFVTTPNQLVHLWPDGVILTSTRVTVTAYCHMRLHDYPFDKQKCNLIFGSYGFDKSEIDYFWKHKENEENIIFGEHAKMKQFTLEEFHPVRVEYDFGDTGVFSKLSFDFTLKREIGFFIINLYLPATLLVILSWVSFWLRRNQTPARVALGITTALTLMTLISGAQSYMPQVPYIRAIDWFLIICFVCVIGSLLEYAVVHHFEKELLITNNTCCMEDDLNMMDSDVTTAFVEIQDCSNIAGEPMHQDSINNHHMKQKESKVNAKKIRTKMSRNVDTIDRISRSVFPLVFTLLNCVYWSIYLS